MLLWCIEGLFVMMLRKDIAPDIGRDAAISKFVPKLLLMRRVIMWLANRFRYSPEPGVVYKDGYDPASVFKTLFSSWGNYHAAFPRGRAFDIAATDPVECDMTYVTKLPESQRTLIEFLCAMLDLRSDIDKIMAASAAMDPMMSAEAFFERRRDLVSEEIFDLKQFVEALMK